MEQGLIVFKHGAIEVTQEQKETFVGFLSGQAPTEAELMLHFDFCARKGVHPLERLIYFTKRQGKYTPITSIDYMRMRAESSGVYAGSDDAVFKGGVKIGQKEYPVSATVTVWKLVEAQRCPFTATARWSEYAPEDLASNAAFMWRTKPYVMLAKCAEALALRKAFPGQLTGLYTQEEFDQSGVQSPVSYSPNQSHGKDEPKSDVIEGEVTVTTVVEEPKSPEPPKDEPKMIAIWDNKTLKPADGTLDIKTINTLNANMVGEGKEFAAPAHLKNHLRKHFHVDTLQEMTWEKANALVLYVKSKHETKDSRWYADEVVVAKAEPKSPEPTEVPNVGVDMDAVALLAFGDIHGDKTTFAMLTADEKAQVISACELVSKGVMDAKNVTGIADLAKLG